MYFVTFTTFLIIARIKDRLDSDKDMEERNKLSIEKE